MARSASARGRPTLEALTGPRFVAAMAVVLFHALEAFSPHAGGYVGRLLSRGYLGVSVFFVLSGFILTYTPAISRTRVRRLGWRLASAPHRGRNSS